MTEVIFLLRRRDGISRERFSCMSGDQHKSIASGIPGLLRHSRHPKERNYCGHAKTYTALAPLAVSASGVGASWLPAIGPPPEVTAMYCRPFTENVIGDPTTCEGSRVCHSSVPLSASRARRYRSIEPLNTSPPPVSSIGE